MTDNEIIKQFVTDVGGVWHHLKKKRPSTIENGYPIYVCTCGREFGGNKAQESFEIHYAMDNPTYSNPVDIVAAIKAIPCGNCEGEGFVKIESKCRWFVGDCTGMGCDIDFDCEGKQPCPTCSGTSKRDRWDEFKGWLDNEWDWGRIADLELYDILTTPILLIQAYSAFVKEVG